MQNQNSGQGDFSDLTVILPTLNEALTVGGMIDELCRQYAECRIIVSDDGSSDGTRETVLKMNRGNVFLMDRRNAAEHGLTASVLDGISAVKTDFFVVMDSDGQHPTDKIGEICAQLRGGADLVLPRRVSVEKEWGLFRRVLSGTGTWMGRLALLARGRNYFRCDVLSGFFGCRTEFWRKCGSEEFKRERFRLRGYKVLLDFLKYAPRGTRAGEVPYRFNLRRAGETKINIKIHWEFIKSCLMP